MSEETPKTEETPKDKPKTAGKCGMGAFDVLTKSTEGVKLPLFLPDGTATDEYLLVLGSDCKRFKKALSKFQNDRVQLANQLKKDKISKQRYDSALEENESILIASLVVGWSFPEDCNENNVVMFFESSPQVQESVNVFAGERTNFFEKPQTD